MDTDSLPVKRKQGSKLTKKERDQLIVDMVTLLQSGYINNTQLAKRLNISYPTTLNLRPVADQIIAQQIPDRNIIRNLSVNRATTMIERLVSKLDNTDSPLTLKEELGVHDKIVKYAQHLALITGLNVETKINVDHKKLVITRAHPEAVKQAIEGEIIKNADKTNQELISELPD